ncbi:hypothetical protein [Nocardia sp. NPDC051570]|uniref:hypothetical protein n=1 Tax=Nocardia sp. NPDC051570 TaxID=3364324 RepID=UPI0037A5A825
MRARGIRGSNIESGGGTAELARLLDRAGEGDEVIPIDATISLADGATAIGAVGARGTTVLAI